jgi:enoyl-CoA hydratase/carnithine racemase
MVFNSGWSDLPDTLAVEQRGDAAILRLSRPAKRNAINPEMLSGIVRFFSALPEGARTVIIHGEGDHFCAGADFSSMLAIDAPSGGAAAGLRLSRLWHHAFARIENAEVPVVAVLHGAVVGGGLELAAAAHIRIAERSAFYALPEASRGIFVGGGASVRIPRLIGVPRMLDMMLSGRVYGAEEGLALGLSQYLVEPGEGLTKALEIGTRIAANPSLTNFAILQGLPRVARADPEVGSLLESLLASFALSDGEATKRLRAFLEKRAPKVAQPDGPARYGPPTTREDHTFTT